MRKKFSSLAWLTLAFTLLTNSSRAQDPAEAAAQAYQEILTEAVPLDGLLRLYTKKDQLLCELGPEHLDHPYLMFTSLKTGIGYGFLVSGMGVFDEWMIAFHRTGNRIELRRLNTRFLSSGDAQLGWVVEEGYSDSVAAVLPIVAENPHTGGVLIDLSGAFFQDLPDLAGIVRAHLPIPYYIDPSRSVWGNVKVFPLNVEIDVQHTLVTDQYFDLGMVLDSRALPLTVRYSLVEPPDFSNYMPRIADDRIGYFLTAMRDLSRPGNEDGFLRFITRWNLQKADPSAEKSPPVQPIVVYLDKSIPYAFRPAVRRGLLEWNKAFEAIGIVDAIEVRFQPDDADWDAEDVRYATVRWSTAAAFVGVSAPRVDPRTGQILDADILINSESLRVLSRDTRFVQQEEAPSKDAILRSLLGIPEVPTKGTQREATHRCQMAQGLGNQVRMAFLGLQAQRALTPGDPPPQEFLDQIVRFVVTHEFGHSLGLRHNFKGSAATPNSRLHDVAYTQQYGLSGSIMDYPAANIAPPGIPQGDFFATTLGAYDYWAIEYGYKPVPGAQSSVDELEELNKIANRSDEPALVYATDEDLNPLTGVDPYANAWDLGAEPLDWAAEQVLLVQAQLETKLQDRLLKDGERFQLLRQLVMSLCGRFYTGVDIAARYVGGYDVRRIRKGQTGAPYLKPIPAALQRKALQFLADPGFRDESLLLPPELLRDLAPETWAHWGMSPDATTDFPFSQLVVFIRALILDRLLSPVTLARLQNAEMAFAEEDERVTLAQVLANLGKIVWSDLTSGESTAGGEAISRFRRPTQRLYLERLISLALKPLPGTPGDASSLARLELVELQARLETALQQADLGPLTHAHLQDCLRLTRQALEVKASLSLP